MSVRIPPPLGAVLHLFRLSRGWSEDLLAREAGISSPSLISDYETGRKPLSRERLEFLLALMDVPPEALDAALFALDLAGPAPAPGSPVDPTETERRSIAAAAARTGSSIVRLILSRLPRALRARRAARDRQLAADLWQTLSGLTLQDLRTVVTVAPKCHSWAFAELLCEESVKMAANRAEMAQALAELAVAVAEKVTRPEHWHSFLLGYAWAFLGNARRVHGDLAGADQAFLHSTRLWQQGEPADPYPLDSTRPLDLEASLRRHQGRFDEALALLDRALAVHSRGVHSGRLLLKKAFTLEQKGAWSEALAFLSETTLALEGHSEPRLLFGILFNRAVCLWHLERSSEAEGLLPEIRELAIELGNELDLVRVGWLRGRIVGGLGRREEALAALLQVQREFTTREIAYDAAQISLEIAIFHLEEGCVGKLKDLAQQMLWIFRAQGVHPEGLAALKLFCDAARQEAVTLTLTRRVYDYLERARQAPGLKFEG